MIFHISGSPYGKMAIVALGPGSLDGQKQGASPKKGKMTIS